MEKIVSIKKAVEISKRLRENGKRIVLVGGCFDIIHPGHIFFLEKAKKQAEILFVLLESDETIRLLKGEGKPIHTQKDRGIILASLSTVDFVMLLPRLKTDKDYDDLLFKIKPTIIATTKGDPKRLHKERQAKRIGAKVIAVMTRLKGKSTSQLAKLLSNDYYI